MVQVCIVERANVYEGINECYNTKLKEKNRDTVPDESITFCGVADDPEANKRSNTVRKEVIQQILNNRLIIVSLSLKPF